MRRMRIVQRSAMLVILLTLFRVAPAMAGGWAVVTLDSVPQGVQAGQQLSLGFMVLQHGVTPIDTAYGAPLIPILTARNTATGETLRAEGRKEGPLGHFVVELTAPAAGAWTWQIEPRPFGATTLGTLAVVPAPTPTTTGTFAGLLVPLSGVAFLREGLRWFGLALLLFAAGLGIWSQRALLFRRQASTR